MFEALGQWQNSTSPKIATRSLIASTTFLTSKRSLSLSIRMLITSKASDLMISSNQLALCIPVTILRPSLIIVASMVFINHFLIICFKPLQIGDPVESRMIQPTPPIPKDCSKRRLNSFSKLPLAVSSKFRNSTSFLISN